MNKQRLKIAGWFAFTLLVVVLLFFARKMQEEALVKKPVIAISVVDENAFLTENELYTRLQRNNLIYAGQQVKDLQPSAIEAFIRKMHEVESVDVFKKFGGEWTIKVKIRQPYARIFNRFGESFYVDSQGTTMDPSPNFTARVLVFSGNISDKSDTVTVAQINANTTLRKQRALDEIYRLAKAINEDPFLHAQIGQVHRDVWGDFILIPLIGNQSIIFGAANSDKDVREKLGKLKTFYLEGLPYEGWNRYISINLKYKNQIVCKKRIEELPPVVVNQ